MPLKSRLGTITFEDGENSIQLRASLTNLRSLAEEVKMDWITYVMDGHCNTPDEFTKLFYHLQYSPESEFYTQDEIYGAFFCDVVHMTDPVFVEKLKNTFASLFGEELQKRLNEVAPPSKKKPTKAVSA